MCVAIWRVVITQYDVIALRVAPRPAPVVVVVVVVDVRLAHIVWWNAPWQAATIITKP